LNTVHTLKRLQKKHTCTPETFSSGGKETVPDTDEKTMHSTEIKLNHMALPNFRSER